MKSQTISLTLIGLALAILAGILLLKPLYQAESAGWNPVAQQLATTTVVGPQGTAVVKNQIFAENAACKSRIITTDGTSAIRISFDDVPYAGNIGSTTVSATVGFLQLASTTKEYDSAIYGCGVWNAWAWASTTLTVAEF